VNVDPRKATLTLQDGTVVEGDVIVGADGVHSVARRALYSNAPEAYPGHHHAFRFTYPKRLAMADPETRALIGGEGVMTSWYGPDHKIVLYPTSNNTLLNFVCLHPASKSESTTDYNAVASKAHLLQVFSDFHPSIVRLLEKVPEDGVKLYPMMDMAALGHFVAGRMALIGDAAHPFTPHLAQGGAMAMEDGMSLGVMLPRGTTPEDIEERLQLYNEARYERATTIQGYSRAVGGDSHDESAADGSEPSLKGKSLPTDLMWLPINSPSERLHRVRPQPRRVLRIAAHPETTSRIEAEAAGEPDRRSSQHCVVVSVTTFASC
jgi:2-polyprenyl-6-methoxyphenol hydroxylase-like FAD-dependent oxidoreductase